MKPKTILITGATAGIGRHAALEFVRLGHHVIAAGRRDASLAELKAEAARIGRGTLDGVRLDVTDPADIREGLATVHALTAGRGIDVLVNNAGYGQMGPLELVSDEALRRQFETNVFGLMSMIRGVVPLLRERGDGRIINLGSVSGRVTFPFMGAYSASKYAVRSLSDALRVELAPFGVSVILVEAGPIRTGFNERAMETVDSTRVERSPYSAALEQADRLRRRFDASAVGPEHTTRALVQAATARRPRIRYVVPFAAWMTMAVLTILPTRIVDAIFQWAAGLTRSRLRLGAANAP
jgi:NAD(P)-dependent dehydrogenase (short-subunit alcohol dehydrogenase family)